MVFVKRKAFVNVEKLTILKTMFEKKIFKTEISIVKKLVAGFTAKNAVVFATVSFWALVIALMTVRLSENSFFMKRKGDFSANEPAIKRTCALQMISTTPFSAGETDFVTAVVRSQLKFGQGRND